MDDYMELGDTGWVAREGGWMLNIYTEQWMDQEGNKFDKDKKPLPDTDEDYMRD